MTSMLEKAARAAWIKVQEGVPQNVRLTEWGRVPEDAKDNFRNFVRAVLTAIRVPDKAMIDAARDPRAGRVFEANDQTFTIMIDAILAEGK